MPALAGSVAPWKTASRKTTVSIPSRSTAKKAMPTSAIAEPFVSASAAEECSSVFMCRACRRIQKIMNVTIPTANREITVSSISCWRCGSSWLRTLSPTPMPTQIATAIATPAHICRSASRRPSWVRKAAMMPTISAASTPSRSPITNVGSTCLCCSFAPVRHPYLGRPNIEVGDSLANPRRRAGALIAVASARCRPASCPQPPVRLPALLRRQDLGQRVALDPAAEVRPQPLAAQLHRPAARPPAARRARPSPAAPRSPRSGSGGGRTPSPPGSSAPPPAAAPPTSPRSPTSTNSAPTIPTHPGNAPAITLTTINTSPATNGNACSHGGTPTCATATACTRSPLPTCGSIRSISPSL